MGDASAGLLFSSFFCFAGKAERTSHFALGRLSSGDAGLVAVWREVGSLFIIERASEYTGRFNGSFCSRIEKGLSEDLGVNLTEVQAYLVDRASEIEWA